MNREIKFRAWHKGTNVSPHSNRGVSFPPTMLYDNKPGDCLRWLSEGQPLDVMQFTGLKDKNGKEVYEGDIIRDCLTKATMQVKFGLNKNNAYNGWYCSYIGLSVRDTSICGDYDTNINSQIEVIGNIHEHPELLK